MLFSRKFTTTDGRKPHWLGQMAHLYTVESVATGFGMPEDHFVLSFGKRTLEFRRARHAAYIAKVGFGTKPASWVCGLASCSR